MTSASHRWMEGERAANLRLEAPYGRCEACKAPLPDPGPLGSWTHARRATRRKTCSSRCRQWLYRRAGDAEARDVDYRRRR